MKKILLLVAIFSGLFLFSQEPCGFDKNQRDLEQMFPENKIAREQAEAKLLAMNVQSYLNSIGATSKNGLYTGTIYEIPVVMHVIQSTSTSNNALAITDAQLQTWVNNTNQMYASTYSTFFSEGTGSLNGNVIPFKLVLAKRTPQCTATTGIVRYNGSTLTGYDAYGVQNSTANGVTAAQVRTLAPHWPENSYFNIYVIIAFDGDKTNYGLMGYAGYPSNSDFAYDSFMKVPAATNANSIVLAHELGHAFGLIHPFDGADANGGQCPVNGDCTTDNDKICDTEPTQSLLSVFPTPTNAATNPCTTVAYAGVQYNVMNYTNEAKKFTAGQRDRAIAQFMLYRSTLTNSLGATDLAVNPGGGSLVAANCIPGGITNTGNYNAGPTSVKLVSINSASSGTSAAAPNYYQDYSLQNCLNTSLYTDIPLSAPSTLSVGFATNAQIIKAWIDFNNNGIFESTESIANSVSSVPIANSPYIAAFTPPAGAKTNIYLRMRVRSDIGSYDFCQNLNYGQIEDYAVRITSSLGTSELSNNQNYFIIYQAENNTIKLISDKTKSFGNYNLYDATGKLVQKGFTKTNEIVVSSFFAKGIYFISFEDGPNVVTKKFIK